MLSALSCIVVALVFVSFCCVGMSNLSVINFGIDMQLIHIYSSPRVSEKKCFRYRLRSIDLRHPGTVIMGCLYPNAIAGN